MITVLVLAVVVMFAYPSYVNLMKNMEAKRVRTALTQANQEAKLYAYLRKQDVHLCLADENDRCHRQAGTKVVLFVDVNRNNALNEGDIVIQQYPLNIQYGTLEMRVSALRSYMRYYGDTGLPRGHFGHVSYCGEGDERGGRSYKVVVSSMGHVRVEGGC